jgi:hypothetical protein
MKTLISMPPRVAAGILPAVAGGIPAAKFEPDHNP